MHEPDEAAVPPTNEPVQRDDGAEVVQGPAQNGDVSGGGNALRDGHESRGSEAAAGDEEEEAVLAEEPAVSGTAEDPEVPTPDEEIVPQEHLPLPPGLKPDQIFSSRARFVSFSVKKKRKLVTIPDYFSLGKESKNSSISSMSTTITFDRKDPTQSIFPKKHQSDNVEWLRSEKGLGLLRAMADINSNCVVVLGNDRLSERLVKEKMQEYHNYESRKMKSRTKSSSRRQRNDNAN